MRIIQLLPLIMCIIVYSCKSTTKAVNAQPIRISVSKTNCGSYEVKNNERVIGYAVPPFYIMFSNIEERVEAEVSKFEKSLGKSQKKHYGNQFRVYHFFEAVKKDTLMHVMILSKIQADTVSNWRCKYLGLDQYGLKYYHKRNRAPGFHSFTFNCTKDRFWIPEDGN